jgi:hypothetical protein
MRTKKHYEDMLDKNPDTSIGFTLAADMVYAAKNGSIKRGDDHGGVEWKNIARLLKSKYGETLSADAVRAEMDAIIEPTVELIVRKIPESLRRDFKSRCAAEGISQQDKIIELMKSYIER